MAVVATLTTLMVSWAVSAQDPAVLAQSDQLFERAKRSQASGELAAACELFAQSYALAARGGTLLNLGLCHEAIGRFVTARSELIAALEFARRDKREEREAILTQHITTIEAKLAWLTVLPPSNVSGDVLRIRLDGSIVDPRVLGAIPIEAGEHYLSASADGYQEQLARVAASAGAKLTIRFEPLASWGAQLAKTAAQEPTKVAAAPAEPIVAPSAPEAPKSLWTPIRTGALVVGLLGIATSLTMGAIAFAAKDTVAEHCPDRRCDATGHAAAKRGAASETAANIAAVVGGVGLVTWVVAPGGWLNPERPRLNAFGLTVSGRF